MSIQTVNPPSTATQQPYSQAVVRSGEEYKAGLRDGRRVWIDGELVADITTHPATAGVVETHARWYDLHQDPAWQDTFWRVDGNGRRAPVCFSVPTTVTELAELSEALRATAFENAGNISHPACWGMLLCGGLWNMMISCRTGNADRVKTFLDTLCAESTFLAGAYTPPQVARFKAEDERGVVKVVEEREDGIVVRAASRSRPVPCTRTGSRARRSRCPAPGTTRPCSSPSGPPTPACGPSCERRISFAWYDAGRTRLMQETGCVTEDGYVVGTLYQARMQHSLIAELDDLAKRSWPSPWRRAIRTAIRTGCLFATPIAEYVPSLLTRNRAVIIGDAGHLASPVVGAGFTTGLLDVESLARRLRETPDDVPRALRSVESDRLLPAQQMVLSGMGVAAGLAVA